MIIGSNPLKRTHFSEFEEVESGYVVGVEVESCLKEKEVGYHVNVSPPH